MRRILLVLSAAALIAAMMVAMAMPAFAGGTCNAPAGEFIQCAGGGGERGGGGGGRGADDLQTGAVEESGGVVKRVAATAFAVCSKTASVVGSF